MPERPRMPTLSARWSVAWELRPTDPRPLLASFALRYLNDDRTYVYCGEL